MKFQKGTPKTGGRQIGTPNRLTGAFRNAVRIVYDSLGGHAAFLKWAKKNPTEYYRIASRLIPGEMQENSRDASIRVIVCGPEGTVRDVQPAGNLRGQSPALVDHSTDDGKNDEASWSA